MKGPIASSFAKTGPLKGLRRFDPNTVSLYNALHCSREPLTLDWNGNPVRLSIVHAAPSLIDDVRFRLCIDDEIVNIACSWQALDGLGAHPDRQRSLREVDPELAALWLESVWLFWLEPLEAFLDSDIRIEPVRQDNDRHQPARGHAATTAMTILLAFEPGEASHLLRIDLSQTLIIRLQPLIERCFPRLRRPDGAVTMGVTLCMGIQHLTLSELRSLRPGDVVLLERPFTDPTRAEVVVGERYTAPASVGSSDLKLLGPLRPARALHASAMTPEGPFQEPDQKEGSMKEPSLNQNAASDEAPAASKTLDLNDLSVRLTCELGRLELTLGELRELGEGSVLPLGRPAERAVDLVIKGRCMGQGRLVTIGDDLGVQIERLDLNG